VLAVATFYVYRRVEVQRGEIRRAFNRYVSPDVVNELIANPAKLELGGEVRDLTLMFCDVRNFTTISERLSAAELTRFINELLTPLSEIVLKHRGTIDKYIGDAIMAFWNAPLDEPGHAAQACRSALEIAARMEELNRQWSARAQSDKQPYQIVRVGIGINTGKCCVGNLGSVQRFDYSAIGDEVNIASRFEGLAKVYGLTAIIGARTVEESPAFPALEVDRSGSRAAPSRPRSTRSAICRRRRRMARLCRCMSARRFTASNGTPPKLRSPNVAALASGRSMPIILCSRRGLRPGRQTPPPKDWDGAFTALENSCNASLIDVVQLPRPEIRETQAVTQNVQFVLPRSRCCRSHFICDFHPDATSF
jgi:adenylate cyclase